MIKLFCIPGGASSAIAYLPWKKYLNKDIELKLLEVAGRGLRYKEKPMKDIETVADDLFLKLKAQLEMDGTDRYALLGQCFGSNVAYELYRRISENGIVKPLHIFVATSSPPNGKAFEKSLFSDENRRDELKEAMPRYFPPSLFSDSEELARFCGRYIDLTYENYAEYGQVRPIPPETMFGASDAKSIEYYEKSKALEFANQTLRLLDLDQKAEREYQLRPKDYIKIESDLTVLSGSHDTFIGLEEMKGWVYFAANNFSIEVISGGHLILLDQYAQCVKAINRILGRYEENET